MSFSSELKSELCAARLEGAEAKNALLAGLIYTVGRREGQEMSLASESSDVVKLALKLLRNTFGIASSINGDENSPFSNKKIYEITFVPNKRFLAGVSFSDDPAEPFKFEASPGYFLRGVMLGVGSVTDPQKAYHLEMVFKEEDRAKWIAGMLAQRFDLNAKAIRRKNSYICYIKEAEHISDFLAAIGSVTALLKFENTRVYKQVTNKINRAINCDTANINKSTDAALAQVAAIRQLKEAGELERLGERYVEIAELRLANPELNLAELGQLVVPALSKSGASHRMRKIMAEAKRLLEGY